MAIQFQHKCLAETHNLGVALATGREIGTALTATHRQRGQRVLESLLKGKEFENRLVHGCVEADSSLVRADSIVVLYAVTHIGLDITTVVYPVDTELYDTIRHTQALYQVHTVKLRMLVILLLNGSQNLTDCLDVLRLIGESALEILNNFYCFHLFTFFKSIINQCNFSLLQQFGCKGTYFYPTTKQIVTFFVKKVEKSNFYMI